MVGVVNHVVVVGAGLAGLRSVEALRARGFSGRITLIGEEPHRPYDRPPLSKAVLAGEVDEHVVDADLDALGVELRTGVVATGLREGALLDLAGEVPYDGLVIATGAKPIRLPGDGPQHVLRTIDDALALRALLTPRTRVVVVGAGWIGAEVATAARRAGCEVTVVEAAPTPLAAALGPAVGRVHHALVRRGRHQAAAGGEGRVGRPGRGHARRRHVRRGRRGGDRRRGTAGDRTGWRAPASSSATACSPTPTCAPPCPAWSPWATAPPGGRGGSAGGCGWSTGTPRSGAPEVAVASLLGEEAVYDPVPYFWSEQFGRMVQYAGHHAGARMVPRGEPSADAKWSVCWLTGPPGEERLAAILTVDRPRDLVQGRRLIEGRHRVDPVRIADPDVTLRDCVVG